MSRKIRRLTAAVAGLILAVPLAGAGASGAITLPSTSLPSLTVPSTSMPSVTVPSVTVPTPVATVTTPPVTVSTPSTAPVTVTTPSVSVPTAGGLPSLPSLPSTSPTSSGASSSSATPSAAPTTGTSPTPTPARTQPAAIAPRVISFRRAAARRARADQRLRRLVRRLHGCLADLPSTSARVLDLRAGGRSRPGLSASATAQALQVSGAREARLERIALGSLRAAARAGCGAAGTPTVLHLAASSSLVAAPPVFTARGSTTPAAGPHPSGRLRSRGVTRASIDRPARSQSMPTMRTAALAGDTPAWAVFISLALLALGGAAALLRQTAPGQRAVPAAPRTKRTPVAGAGTTDIAEPPSKRAAFAYELWPQETSDPVVGTALDPSGPGVGTALEPAGSTAVVKHAGARRGTTPLAAVIATAVVSGLVRLLSRHNSGRRR